MKVCEVLDGFGLTVAQLKDAGSAPKFNQANQVKVHVDDRVVEVDGRELRHDFSIDIATEQSKLMSNEV